MREQSLKSYKREREIDHEKSKTRERERERLIIKKLKQVRGIEEEWKRDWLQKSKE